MTEKARKCLVENLDEKLKTTIKHRDIGRPVSYPQVDPAGVVQTGETLDGGKRVPGFY